jgi:hypothetical protein
MDINDHYVAQFLNVDALEETNQRITSWRLSLRDSRIDRLDDDGMADMILYHAVSASPSPWLARLLTTNFTVGSFLWVS